MKLVKSINPTLTKIIEVVLNKKDENNKLIYNEILLNDNITFLNAYRDEFSVCKYDDKTYTTKTIDKIINLLITDEIEKEKKTIYKILEYNYNGIDYILKMLIYDNFDRRNINIKILYGSFIYPIKKFSKSIEEKEELSKKFSLFLQKIKNKYKGGLYIVSFEETFKKKNFLYSLINELNENIDSKIISLEDIIELDYKNNKSYITQQTYTPELLENVKYFGAHYLFIEKELTSHILDYSIKNALNNLNVILITQQTDKNKIINYIKNVLSNDKIINYEDLKKIDTNIIFLEKDKETKETKIKDIECLI